MLAGNVYLNRGHFRFCLFLSSSIFWPRRAHSSSRTAAQKGGRRQKVFIYSKTARARIFWASIVWSSKAGFQKITDFGRGQEPFFSLTSFFGKRIFLKPKFFKYENMFSVRTGQKFEFISDTSVYQDGPEKKFSLTGRARQKQTGRATDISGPSLYTPPPVLLALFVNFYGR